MSNINIILYFDNTKYRESLARGLCYEYAGLNVFFAKDREEILKLIDRGILLTDIYVPEPAKTIFFSDKNNKEYKYSLSKKSPVKRIMETIRRIAFDEYGEYLCGGNYQTKVLQVFSKKGGLGVTSFAITLARLLSAETESKILYLNVGPMDDYEEFFDSDNFEVLEKREFLLLSEENIKVNILNYLQQDVWSVYYFKPEKSCNTIFCYEGINKLINDISSTHMFSFIVVDLGKNPPNTNNMVGETIEVTKNEVFYTGKHQHFSIELHRDNDSFYTFDGKTNISLKGIYAQTINRFIERCDFVY